MSGETIGSTVHHNMQNSSQRWKEKRNSGLAAYALILHACRFAKVLCVPTLRIACTSMIAGLLCGPRNVEEINATHACILPSDFCRCPLIIEVRTMRSAARAPTMNQERVVHMAVSRVENLHLFLPSLAFGIFKV
jgi:hypothetical protein